MKIMIEFLQNSIGICFVIEFAYCVREIVEFVFLWFLLSSHGITYVQTFASAPQNICKNTDSISISSH